MKKIRQILVDQVGWIFSKDGDIVAFEVNGAMATTTWYDQANSNRQFNGEYVIEIQYEDIEECNHEMVEMGVCVGCGKQIN
jgi:hypothetical protein